MEPTLSQIESATKQARKIENQIAKLQNAAWQAGRKPLKRIAHLEQKRADVLSSVGLAADYNQ